MSFDFSPKPHEEAAALIKGKPVVTREVFEGLLPELRGRAFAVTGVESAHVLQRARDIIATLPRGVDQNGDPVTWDTQKQQLIDELDPYLGDGAATRAELLLRTHGFQAMQAANWRVIQEDEDTTHIQYLATEDDRVRDTHLALNGIVLPKDDPFWLDHYPPWEWNCRCRARAMNPDQVEIERALDETRNPEDQNVIEGPALKQLHDGTLIRGTRRYDVTAPKDGPEGDKAFQWHPDNLRLPIEQLEQRYDAETWKDFKAWARATDVAKGGPSVWEWLNQEPT